MIDFRELTPSVKVTDKRTGFVYFGYKFVGKTSTYTEYVRNGVVECCTCNAYRYGHGKPCKHMEDFQRVVDCFPSELPGKIKADRKVTKIRVNGRIFSSIYPREAVRLAIAEVGKMKTSPAAPPVLTDMEKKTNRSTLNGNRPFSFLKSA